METLCLIVLASSAYFAWRTFRLSSEPVVTAIDADDVLDPDLEETNNE